MGVVDWVGRGGSGGLVVLSLLLVTGIFSLGTGAARANDGKVYIGLVVGTLPSDLINFRDETVASRSFAALTGKMG